MPKILFVIPELEFDHPTAQLTQILGVLPRQEFDCRIFVIGKAGTPATTLRQHGFAVDAPGKGRGFDVNSLVQLRGLVQSFQPQVVHAWGLSALRALLISGFKGRRIVSPCPRPDVKRSWWRFFDGWQLRKAAHVVAFGAVEAERCRILGVRPDQLTVVQPAVHVEESGDTPIPGLSAETRFVLCVGRLLSYKGFQDAIWALDILRYVHPHLHLVIAGAGPERYRLQQFTDDLEAARSVHLVGETPEVFGLMRRAEIIWSPGRSETGTQVILEAMALGKPIVASRFPRLAELIVDGESGLLTPAEDKALLARQTQRLLSDPALRTQLGESAHRRVQERHRPEKLGEALSRLYGA